MNPAPSMYKNDGRKYKVQPTRIATIFTSFVIEEVGLRKSWKSPVKRWGSVEHVLKASGLRYQTALALTH
jgi:hypothetical protein